MAMKKQPVRLKLFKARQAKLRKRQAKSNRLSFDQLESRNLLAADFGDAPFPYQVTISENGARHTTGVLRLGSAAVDMEADGTHSALADFDDLNGSTPGDEDGVTFGTIQVGALQQTVTVNVQGAAGQLDAWIDFNGDGNWGGAGEQIFASRSVSVGDNNLTFDVPSGAVAGQTFARFRLSTAGSLGVIGVGADGEVEDHVVTIESPTASPGIFSTENRIGEADFLRDADDLVASDMDGDGDWDLLATTNSNRTISWYENVGNHDFVEHIIEPSISRGPYGLIAVDLDSDGDMDVISAEDEIAWYENDGSQNFTKQIIIPDAVSSILAADVDGDGDLDVVSTSGGYNRFAWHENDGSQNFVSHSIDSIRSAFTVFAADVDRDGDLDIVSASTEDDTIVWYENENGQNFTERIISTTVSGVASVYAADLDKDGDMDLLSAELWGDKVVWYENDGNQNFVEHTIDFQADAAWSVYAADLDGDGDLDVLGSSWIDGTVEAYLNDGNKNFVRHVISNTIEAVRRAIPADLDGDGDLDVVTAARSHGGNGGIAWYENLNIDPATDFGDSPAPYPTTLADDGPRHVIGGPQLGPLRDGEIDGSNSTNSDSDGADEDGITFGTIQVGSVDATVNVLVQNDHVPNVGGRLDAWIDFNGDGNWGGAGEQIFSSQDLVVGGNQFTFTVPADAIDGQTFARFRVSSEGGLGVTGFAYDGEVEDYEVTIIRPVVATGSFEPQDIVGGSADDARSVFGADVDGDGDLDVVSGSYSDDKIAWYENDGNENFTEHVISFSANGVKSVYAADIDGDGDMDVVSASSLDDKIAWYENDGSQVFAAHTISTSALGATSVFVSDVDGDGDLDVLSTSANDGKVIWYENEGDGNFFTRKITSAADGAQSVFTADIDGDGDLDVLSASANDDKIAWYENDGNNFFTTRTISTSADGASSVIATDLDDDGDLDVLSASFDDDKIAWYENDGNQNFTEHVISTSADGAKSVIVGDFDGDGDMDVMSASADDDTIAWYENDGGENFTFRVVTQTADGAQSVFAIDVDRDGDLDLLSASANDDTVAWYKNRDIDRDFGDAPAPYPTTTAENGPRHDPTGPTLGASRDSEFDGSNSGNASSDGADEDGVNFGLIQVGALDATVIVNVQGGAGKLDAWIDFNGDGSWGGPGEQIFDSRSVVVGDNSLTFDVPSGAIDGQTVARFRLSTAGALGVFGLATDGEVEDYLVTVTSPISSFGVFSDPQEIGSAGESLVSADIDGDGDMDLASHSNNMVTWFENDGSQNFTPQVVGNISSGSVREINSADVDGDGDIDFLAASIDNSSGGRVFWFENDGDQNFSVHTLTGVVSGTLFAADLDNDGDLDFVSSNSSSYLGSRGTFWYENDGSQNFSSHTISSTIRNSVFVADVDGDGDVDVLSSSSFSGDDELMWHENDGSQNFSPHVISSSEDRAYRVYAVDLDGDGDTDVLSSSHREDKIAWYENDGSESFVEHTISTVGDDARSVQIGDLDGDGDLDVFSSLTNNDTVVWYVNDGSQNFVRQVISDTADGARRSIAADLDGDGDLDVVNAFYSGNPLTWYENISDISFVGNVFYNDSSFDSGSDFDAIDRTKRPLRNGQVATFANYTSYSKGINGLVIDVESLNEVPTLATVSDFLSFKVGNNNSPSTWANAPLPIGLVYESEGAGIGKDRITLTWADNAIENTWLQVSLQASASTGQKTPDTFYLGNAIAETGSSQSDAIVNLVDVALTRSNQTGFDPATISNVYDFNRDSRVNLVDVAIARSNQTGFGSLRLIDLSNVSKGSDFAENPVSDESLVKGSFGSVGEVTKRQTDKVSGPVNQVATTTQDKVFGQWSLFAFETHSQVYDDKSKFADSEELNHRQKSDIDSLDLVLNGSTAELDVVSSDANKIRNAIQIEDEKKHLDLDQLVESRFELDLFT